MVNLTIDPEIVKEAKGRLMNISVIAESALRAKLKAPGGKETISEKKACIKCGSPESLLWDGLYEYWICEKCNNAEIKKVSICCASRG